MRGLCDLETLRPTGSAPSLAAPCPPCRAQTPPRSPSASFSRRDPRGRALWRYAHFGHMFGKGSGRVRARLGAKFGATKPRGQGLCQVRNPLGGVRQRPRLARSEAPANGQFRRIFASLRKGLCESCARFLGRNSFSHRAAWPDIERQKPVGARASSPQELNLCGGTHQERHGKRCCRCRWAMINCEAAEGRTNYLNPRRSFLRQSDGRPFSPKTSDRRSPTSSTSAASRPEFNDSGRTWSNHVRFPHSLRNAALRPERGRS